ncbi:MAG: radical SAM protein [Myxococcales bacterium]|nr:radical SAM protein [Myxococcales bacterium]
MTDKKHSKASPPIGAMPEGEARDTRGRRIRYDGDPEHLVRGTTDADRADPHPLYVVWEITLRCDLGCKHCGSRAGKARSHEMSTEECLEVVRQLAEMRVREVTLIGGEAYLREDWDVIARAITDAGMVCGMTTGARNLDADRVRRAVDAGLRSISVSIDGLEMTHDAQRGARGSFRAALEAAERVAASPIILAANTQINRLSMPEMPSLAELLVEIGARAWQIQITVPMGRGADRPDLILQPHDLLELFPLLVYIKQEILEPGGVQLFPGNNIGYFGPYEHLLRYGAHLGAHWGGCAAGKWCLGLEADGKIKGCPSLPSADWTGGYADKEPIAKVVAETRELRYLSERTRDDLWGFCRDCYYGDICKGGCTWTTECIVGKPGNNPYCIHRALELEKQGKRERLVKVEAAPGVPFDRGRFEIVEEPMPELAPDEAPTVLGLPLAHITGLGTSATTAWSDEAIARALDER